MNSICAFEGAKWFLFGPNVPPLIYYSHIPNILIAVTLGLLILFHNRKSLANRILFFTILAFEVWVFFALVFWASNRGDVIMFAWLMDILVEPLVYIGCLYLLYVLVDKRDLSFKQKLLLVALYLPVPIFLPTPLMLSSFNMGTCLAEEGFFAMYYTYFVEIFATVWALLFTVSRFASKTGEERKQVAFLGIGTLLLLFAFAWGNIIGSFSEDWVLGDYGLFGMPVFLGFLVYSIVRFRLFQVKIIGATALMVAVWALTASLLAIQDIDIAHAVIAATLIPTTILGWMLINSVRKEVSLREDLETANAGQADLLHIINHQIKGYLTKARYAFDDLLNDSTYGLSEKAKPLVKQGYDSVTEGVNFVQDFLNAANIEKGTFTYSMAPMEFDGVVAEEAEEQKPLAEKKGLAFKLDIASGDYRMTGDKAQLTQAVRNLIDNSVRYTPHGSVAVSLERKIKSIVFRVSDTGVGLSEEVKPKLFTKGGRDRNSQKINVNSTGFGLAFVKGVAEAHKGRVWAESAGTGRGSTFWMELPAA